MRAKKKGLRSVGVYNTYLERTSMAHVPAASLPTITFNSLVGGFYLLFLTRKLKNKQKQKELKVRWFAIAYELPLDQR
mgnify:CR=1 FL=1